MHNLDNTRPSFDAFSKTERLAPSGGLDRLAAAGIQLTNAEVDRALNVNAEPADPRWASMVAWPVGRDCNGDLIVAGMCPLCQRVHSYGANAALKAPHCSPHLPPFGPDTPTPDAIRLLFALDCAPEDIEYAYQLPSERTAGLRDLAAAFLRGGSYGRRWNAAERRTMTEAAFQHLLRCGALAERIAIKEIDGGRKRSIARREALVEFVAARGPGRWQVRVARALWFACLALERGA